MVDDTINAGGEKAKAAPDAANKERIEAVEARENFPTKLLGLIGLLAEKNRVNVPAFKEHHPVFGEERMKDGHEINGGGAARRLAFGPDANDVDLGGNFEIALPLVGEVFHPLEGGDEFAGADVMGEILDGVAGGEHGLMVEEVGDVGNREHDDLGEVFPASLGGSGQGTGIFYFKIRAKAGAEELLRLFFLGCPTNHIWKPEIGMVGGTCKGRDISISKSYRAARGAGMTRSRSFAEERTPGTPAPGWVPAPHR